MTAVAQSPSSVVSRVSSDNVRSKSTFGLKSSIFEKFNPFNNSKKSEKSSNTADINELKMKGTLLRPTNGEIPSADGLRLTTEKPKNKPIALFDIKFVAFLLLFVVCLSGTVIIWFTDIYWSEIFKSLTLVNDTALHNSWKRPPLEPLLCIRFFNYTNVDEFWEGQAPDLSAEEIGPYCYRETIERLNITFTENNTLIYNERRTHVFDPEASEGLEDDIVVFPNIPMISAFALTVNMNRFLRFGVDTILSTMDQKPFASKNVSELLFGYSDSIVDGFKNVAGLTGKPVPYDKFGLLVKRAGVSKDRVTIRTGEDNLEEMGQVTNINGMDMFSAWSTDECNQVSGSDGLFFRRSRVRAHEDIGLFYKDACRSLPLSYSSTVDVGSGIMANRYKLRRDVFENDKAENECYCVTDVCKLGNGIFDVSKCSNGAPMLLSKPHFLDATVNENNTIKGMKPNISIHDFHIDVFPPLGLTVRTVMKMQMNVMIRNPHGSSNLGPLKDKFILPVVWVEMNSGEVPKKMFSLLYAITYTMRWIELALMWGLLVLTLIFGIFIMRYSVNRASPSKEIIIISKKQSLTTNTYVPP